VAVRKTSEFGRRLQAGMLQAGILNTRELAEKIGADNLSDVHNWLYEPCVENMDARTLWRLGEVLNMSPRWLLLGEGFPNRRKSVRPNATVLLDIFEAADQDEKDRILALARRGRGVTEA
jgi:hypothetical protein